MRVTIFTQFFPPEMEPSGFMFDSFASYLAKQDRIKQIDVISGFANFPQGKFINRDWLSFFRTTKKNGINHHNVFVVPSDNKSNIKRIINYTSFLFASLIRGLFLKSPDIVIATSPPIFSALAGLIVAKIKGSKFVLDIRDIWPESAIQMGSIKNKFIIKVLEKLEIFLYKNSSLITVATPGMVDLVKEKMGNDQIPVEYIPCGVRIPKNDNTSKTIDNPFEIEDHSKFCVLYAGLHGYAQNLSTIVDAAFLLRDDENIVFYFIGEGPDKQRVLDYAKKLGLQNIRFLSPVSRETIRNYFKFTGCAIVPLRDLEIFKNVFPSKTFELMSYGVPSVVGVGGEIGRLIEKNQAGISVKPEDSRDYAEAIKKYSSNSDLCKTIKNNALKTAKTEFDYKVVNKRFFKLLTKILE